MTEGPIPVTVLTGFLGSGKTTLLNRILTEQHGQRIAVIENEFGEIGIDEALVINADEEIFDMNNGCICCTVRGDLIRVLGQLARRKGRFDRVVVETTGIADPGPVAATFFMDDEVKEHYRLDGIVTLVDSKHLLLHLDDNADAREQVAFADVLVLNKTDLVSEAELDALDGRLRKLNAMARRYRTTRSDVPIAEVLDIGGFDLRRTLERQPDFLEDEHHHDHDHEHCDDPDHHHDHDHVHVHHDHGADIGTVSLQAWTPLDRDRLNLWISTLLREKGQDIFRMKGILNVEGIDDRVVVQGVHMLFDSEKLGPWGDAERKSQIVFIGRHLDRAVLEAGLKTAFAGSA